MASKMKRPKAKRYRALVDMSLRRRPDPKCEDWHDWEAGEVFVPPEHMRVDLALARGIMEEVIEDGEA